MNQMYDVIIIGAGPAGLSAALYTSRMNLSTLILTSDVAGGQLLETEKIDNYLGSISRDASELADSMIEHALEFGATLNEFERVDDIHKLEDGQFEVITDRETYYSNSVIVATGTHHKTLYIDRRITHQGQGFSYCAVCDAPYYENSRVIVVGGGDTAFESALLLADHSEFVTIVSRSKERAKPYLVDAVNDAANIEVIYGNLTTIDEDTILSSVEIELNDQSIIKKDVSGIFVCIGSQPSYSHLHEFDFDVDEAQYLKVDKDQKIVDGLFVAGDMMRSRHRQVSIAVADGTIAALEAYDYITQIEKTNGDDFNNGRN